jgi:hypothetical protein
MQNLNTMENNMPMSQNELISVEDNNPHYAQNEMLNGISLPPPLPNNQDMIGAIKIKDALFIGDELAAQDLEFVVNNKVTHIIN